MLTRLLSASLVALGACQIVSTAPEIPTLTIAATEFLEASEGVAASADQVGLAAGRQWFSFAVEIPVAGRYRVEVTGRATAAEPTVIHLEDAIDNQDGRHYDIIHDNQSLCYGLLGLQRHGFPVVATTNSLSWASSFFDISSRRTLSSACSAPISMPLSIASSFCLFLFLSLNIILMLRLILPLHNLQSI